MHVLILPTERFCTAREPLSGIFQWQQAVALRKHGIKVGILSLSFLAGRRTLSSYPYKRNEDVDGIPIIRRFPRRIFPDHRLTPGQVRDRYENLALKSYASYVERFGRPDVIHAHNHRHAAFLAAAISRIHKIPFIITEHSSEYLRGTYDRKLLPSLANCAVEAFAHSAVSRALAEKIKQLLGVPKIDVIPNPIDPHFTDTPPEHKRSENGSFTFLSIGSLDENKNHVMLLRAFAQEFAKKDFMLRIGGEGPLRSDLEQLCDSLDITLQVRFLGHLSRDALRDEMQQAHAFALSSRAETFGVVLVEALYFGLPLIATKAGGPDEIVNEGNGYLVDVDDVSGMAAAMAKVVMSRNAYDPSHLSQEALTRFGAASIARRLIMLYETAL